ncbi:MAG: Mov34/MPN/PAD-1 family protein [Candidatus Promineofilum sp.]|nr:Mov34/MPN/PAD-1 family protein [Promineifilum sp.]
MTDKTNVTYVAQISLTLPGRPETVTAVVTLAPADKIPLGDKVKPLAACTLAELSAYAEALEADVWDAYEAISLLDLRRDEQVIVRVAALDDQGQAADEIEDWLNQAIVLAPRLAEPLESAASEDPAEAAASDDPQPEHADEPLIEPAKPEPPLTAAPEPAAEPVPITVAKPVPPHIIPSQARVRVAGGRLPLAESSGAAVDILLDEAPLRAMQAHALSSLDREVAGVMVGRQPEKQPDGRYVVHVIDSIIAQHTVMQGASVTYTPESWRYMTDTLWERYPDESAFIVGWYHTHPGFGIFLSGMDLFIHQNFFTQLWHVAYVLDPRARTSGFFCWNRQRTKVNRYDFLWPAWMDGSW